MRATFRKVLFRGIFPSFVAVVLGGSIFPGKSPTAQAFSEKGEGPSASSARSQTGDGEHAAEPVSPQPNSPGKLQPHPQTSGKDHKNLLIYWDDGGQAFPVRTQADWQRRRADILRSFQEVAGPLPDRSRRCPLEVQILQTEETPQYRRIRLTYCPEPGDRVPAWLLLPKNLKGPTAAMLCLHPTASSGKDVPAGLAGTPSRHYAHELTQLGFVTLSPDYPSFGEYKYDFRTQGAHYASGTMKAIWNNIRAVDLLSDRPEVDPERIGCIGHSLGGHNAIFTALWEPRLTVVVSSCGFTAFADYFGGKLAGWTSDRYMPRIRELFGNDPDRVPFDFYELIAALAPRPFLTNSPLHDDNFDIAGVKKVLAEAKKIYELYGVPENLMAYHPECGHDFPESVRKEIYAFLCKYFRITPPRETSEALLPKN